MSGEECWGIIEKARAASKGEVSRQAELIESRLSRRKPADIMAVNAWVRERMLEANRTDLLLVVEWVYQAHGLGPVGGDGWEYWRAWLVARGRKDYDAALADADAVADFFTDVENFLAGEEIEYAAVRAYEDVTEDDAPDEMYEPSLVESWPPRLPEDQMTAERLAARFPKMMKRFGRAASARGA